MGSEEIKNLFQELSVEEMERLEVAIAQILKSDLDKDENDEQNIVH